MRAHTHAHTRKHTQATQTHTRTHKHISVTLQSNLGLHLSQTSVTPFGRTSVTPFGQTSVTPFGHTLVTLDKSRHMLLLYMQFTTMQAQAHSDLMLISKNWTQHSNHYAIVTSK